MTRSLPSWPMPVNRCACGKVSYTSRSDARRAARSLHPGQHKNAYRCTTGLWHVGDVAPHVIEGRAARWHHGEGQA